MVRASSSKRSKSSPSESSHYTSGTITTAPSSDRYRQTSCSWICTTSTKCGRITSKMPSRTRYSREDADIFSSKSSAKTTKRTKRWEFRSAMASKAIRRELQVDIPNCPPSIRRSRWSWSWVECSTPGAPRVVFQQWVTCRNKLTNWTGSSSWLRNQTTKADSSPLSIASSDCEDKTA